jgi:pilus assembly protein CpaB
MRIVTIAMLGVALVAAGAIAYLLNGLLSKPVAVKPPETMVLIASKSLPAGSVIDEGVVKWQVWPEGEVPETYISTVGKGSIPDSVLGAVVRRVFSEGEPIVAGKIFKRDAPGYLAGSLSAGMRASTISVNADSGISGFVFPGDSVDVILTHDTLVDVFSQKRKDSIEDAGASPPFIVKYISEMILKDIRVLAIDQKVNDFETKAVPVKQVTLEVRPKQAEILATAKSMGKLSLVLRSLESGADTSDELSFTTDVEVSPLMRNLGNLDQILNKRLSDKERQKRAEELVEKAKLLAEAEAAKAEKAGIDQKAAATAATAAAAAAAAIEPERLEILVALTDLPVGTILSKDKARWIAWPENSLNRQYIKRKEDQSVSSALVDMVVKRPISSGEPLNSSKLFKRGEAGFLSGALRPGLRATTISVTAASAASGFILPGDYVDVILTHDTAQTVFCRGCVAGDIIARKLLAKDAPLVLVRRLSENILSKVRVLALDQKLDDFDATAIMASRVTLEVTRKQAEKLATAAAMGALSLALRSLTPSEAEAEPFAFTTDVEVSPLLQNIDQVLAERKRVITGAKLVSQTPKRRQPPASAPTTNRSAPTTNRSAPTTMKVYRGVNSTTQRFGGK